MGSGHPHSGSRAGARRRKDIRLRFRVGVLAAAAILGACLGLYILVGPDPAAEESELDRPAVSPVIASPSIEAPSGERLQGPEQADEATSAEAREPEPGAGLSDAPPRGASQSDFPPERSEPADGQEEAGAPGSDTGPPVDPGSGGPEPAQSEQPAAPQETGAPPVEEQGLVYLPQSSITLLCASGVPAAGFFTVHVQVDTRGKTLREFRLPISWDLACLRLESAFLCVPARDGSSGHRERIAGVGVKWVDTRRPFYGQGRPLVLDGKPWRYRCRGVTQVQTGHFQLAATGSAMPKLASGSYRVLELVFRALRESADNPTGLGFQEPEGWESFSTGPAARHINTLELEDPKPVCVHASDAGSSELIDLSPVETRVGGFDREE